jgi:hypothetical protein
MTNENDLWTQFLAGAVLVLTIYPIVKDWSTDLLHNFISFIVSGVIAIVLVYIGKIYIEKILKSETK